MEEKLKRKSTSAVSYKDVHTTLKGLYQEHQNKIKAPQMAAYMRNLFSYYGIQNPIRKSITKEIVTHLSKNFSIKELEDVLLKIWELPQREYQYFVLDVLTTIKAPSDKKDLKFFEKLLLSKSWWDSVDTITPNLIAKYFKEHPEQIAPTLIRWTESKNIWLIRAAIIFQLKYKKDTDEKLLFSIILKNKDSKEFFIQKAMGWALRQYARTNSKSVINFVKTHKESLPVLTVREALKRV